MIFITGANYRFRHIIQEWIKHISTFGYDYIIYDLGDLCMGKRGFEETDTNFQTLGYYNSIGGKWKSTGLWKPRCIIDALECQDDNIIYLDADAWVMEPFIIDWNFDIGVVKRIPNPEEDPIKIFLRGDFNAGVLFFNNNNNVKDFIKKWQQKIKITNNDQAALSLLLKDNNNLRMKIFDEKYNNPNPKSIIYHMSGSKKMGKKIRENNL